MEHKIGGLYDIGTVNPVKLVYLNEKGTGCFESLHCGTLHLRTKGSYTKAIERTSRISTIFTGYNSAGMTMYSNVRVHLEDGVPVSVELIKE